MLGGHKIRPSAGRQQLKLKMADSQHHHHRGGGGGGRMRNDSGCFDDDCSSSTSSGGGGGGSPDFLSAHWAEVVAQWAGKNHSIIAQEAVRMKQMTDRRRAELCETKDAKERGEIAQRWRDDIGDIMATTQDLIQCVANDVTEVSLSPAASRDEEAEAALSSQDLGRIIEEELFDADCDEDEDNDDVKMYLVRTKRKRRQRRRNSQSKAKAAAGSGGRRDSGEIEMDDGAILLSEQSFTIQVDRVQRERAPDPMEREVRSGSWQWRKDMDSPVIWGEADEGDVDTEVSCSEVEDIYADWITLLRRRRSRNFVPEDIGEVFWTIGLEDRCPAQGRRFSEVLENAPFTDRPDILEDRCELLEGDKRRSRRFKQVRPKKMYWNIFNEWRKIFREEGEATAVTKVEKKKARRRPRKKPRRMRRKAAVSPPEESSDASAEKATSNNKKRSNRSKKRPTLLPRRSSIHVIEDYFADFLPSFNDEELGNRRRRSLDLLDAQQNERNAKRIKLEQRRLQKADEHRDWELIRVEKSRNTLEVLTKSIERKIREAFVSEISVEEAAAACCQDGKKAANNKEKKEYDGWPKQMARRIRKSRRKFEKLRGKMRKMRDSRRRSLDLADELDAFEEWRWNLDEVEPEPEPEDLFQEWRELNMDGGNGVSGDATAVVAKTTGKVSKGPRKLIVFPKKAEEANKRKSIRRSNLMAKRTQAAKKDLRLRVKSFAKQPRQRGLISNSGSRVN